MDPLGATALFFTMLLISAVPGPVDFAVIGRSISHGFAAAMWFVGGVLLAEVVLVGAAVYGLSALMGDYGLVYRIVIWVSAILLVAMGVLSWRSAGQATRAKQEASEATVSVGNTVTGVLTGFLMTAGDPKAIVFYMAFLPAFVDLTTIGLDGFFTVLIIALCAVSLVKTVYAFGAVRAMNLFASRGVQGWFQRTAAIVLIATGVFLAGRELF